MRLSDFPKDMDVTGISVSCDVCSGGIVVDVIGDVAIVAHNRVHYRSNPHNYHVNMAHKPTALVVALWLKESGFGVPDDIINQNALEWQAEQLVTARLENRIVRQYIRGVMSPWIRIGDRSVRQGYLASATVNHQGWEVEYDSNSFHTTISGSETGKQGESMADHAIRTLGYIALRNDDGSVTVPYTINDGQ